MTMAAVHPLIEVLAARKRAILDAWLARTLQSYPEHTSRFLRQEKDPFRNPVGHTLKEGLPGLFDQLVGRMDAATVRSLLDGIVRIRAVQDFSASQAVAFVFALKRILRDELHSAPQPPLSGCSENAVSRRDAETQRVGSRTAVCIQRSPAESRGVFMGRGWANAHDNFGGEGEGEGGGWSNALAALEDRIDQMALLAFDLFMQCREQICEIKVNEAKRRVGLLLERCGIEGGNGETENRRNGDGNFRIPDSPTLRFTGTPIHDGSKR